MTPSLYIHVPFCDGKCTYCAFYSVAYREDSADRYLDALSREMALYAEPQVKLRPPTIYMGGGTPSALGVEGFKRLVGDLSVYVDMTAASEWSMELNPGNLEPGLLQAMKDAGVTRVSIGAQAFDDPTLETMGRRHRVKDTLAAVAAVAAGGFDHWGLDLIAGYPGVSPATWRETLRQALSLGPSHLSVYDLSVEPGTRMAQRVERGIAITPPESATLAALQVAVDLAEDRGLRRYEISNFAHPGRECFHNLNCWRGGDYVGFGPAASSRLGRRRWTNRADLDGYVAALAGGEPPPREEETLPPETDLCERLMFGFRLAEGVDMGQFQDVFSPTPDQVERWIGRLAGLSREGLLVEEGGRWRPTERGFRLADRIAAELL